MTETAAAALLPIPVTQQQSGAPCPTVAATILSQRASLKAANLLIVNRATTHSRRRAGMGGEKTEDICRCSFLCDTLPLCPAFFMRVQCLVKKIHLARRYNSDCDFQFSTTLQHQYKPASSKRILIRANGKAIAQNATRRNTSVGMVAGPGLTMIASGSRSALPLSYVRTKR